MLHARVRATALTNLVCSASQPSMHRAFEQKLGYFTWFTITTEIKHSLPCHLSSYNSVQSKQIWVCHLNKSWSFVLLLRNQCKMDILSEESTEKPEPWQATAVSSLGCISRSIPPCAQTNVTLRRNSHYFRLICKNWPLTLITAPYCASGLYL